MLSARNSALHVIDELSKALPEDLNFEIRELQYSNDNLRLGGFTDSFDAVNQAADRLEQSSFFANVTITDAKMSLDGSRVDFQLSLAYSERRQQ